MADRKREPSIKPTYKMLVVGAERHDSAHLNIISSTRIVEEIWNAMYAAMEDELAERGRQ